MIVPEIERELWRWRLFGLFCARTRIDNLIVQDLRPLWEKAASADHPHLRLRSFSELGRWVSGIKGQPSDHRVLQ
jgi:hypothetical protein